MTIKTFHFNFSTTNQFHVLSHFRQLDENYLKAILENTSYTKNDIDVELQKEGSKFNPDFASNPLALMELLKAEIEGGNYRSVAGEGNKMDFVIHFGMETGTTRIISIDELTPEEIRSMKMIRYRNTSILKADIKRTIPTNQVNLVTRRNENHFEIITVFPGIYAPPLPDKEKQPEEDYKASKEFWEGYVFV